jgi:peroxiredoxin 2/4
MKTDHQDTSLSINDRFPRMIVQTTYGEMTLPDNCQGQWFILFSHPGNFTPVCTTEFVAFQQLYPVYTRIDPTSHSDKNTLPRSLVGC